MHSVRADIAPEQVEWENIELGRSESKLDAYLEIGKRRCFAGLMDWPGWCRSGRNEEAAFQALLDYAPRYAHVLQSTKLGFHAPAELSAFEILERLEGNATTDFGAPAVPPSRDLSPVDETHLRRFQSLLQACWQAFDSAVGAAEGAELRKGPRGGGRDRAGIIKHVLDADASYLARLGWKFKAGETIDYGQELARTREAIMEALPPAVRGELPSRGPRGGIRWSPRFFVRRVAWHVLDHAWEIEDRIV